MKSVSLIVCSVFFLTSALDGQKVQSNRDASAYDDPMNVKVLATRQQQSYETPHVPVPRRQSEPVAAVQEEQVWTDPATALTWTKHDNGSALGWAEANTYCSGLGLGGYTDWRLPTIEELQGVYKSYLTDAFSRCPYSPHAGYCDPTDFNNATALDKGAPNLNGTAYYINGDIQLSSLTVWSASNGRLTARVESCNRNVVLQIYGLGGCRVKDKIVDSGTNHWSFFFGTQLDLLSSGLRTDSYASALCVRGP